MELNSGEKPRDEREGTSGALLRDWHKEPPAQRRREQRALGNCVPERKCEEMSLRDWPCEHLLRDSEKVQGKQQV